MKSALRNFLAICMTAILLASCEDDLSTIGSSLADDEVTISVDSLYTSIESKSLMIEAGDGRNLTKLLGRIRVPEYGSLNCSFVSQMLSAQRMVIPDSITENHVDSMRLILSVPTGELTGDSLAPQQLKVYRLTKELPSGIKSDFNPKDYYDASSLMGTRSYTLSNIAKGDSAMKNESYIRIPVQMPKEFALDIFRKYRENSPIFDWPSSFNAWFPGIYVESNFGNGCIANIAKAEMFTYWHYTTTEETTEDDTTVTVETVLRDSVCLLASQPEVLSSNIISYEVSDHLKDLAAQGKSIVTTPGGYISNIMFPLDLVLNKYNEHGGNLAIVSSLKMDIPAKAVSNDYGIGTAPYLLMVKNSEREQFFAENKLPDGENAFYAAYDSENGCYKFSALRQYFLNLLTKVNSEGRDAVTAEDLEFSLVPVYVETESVTSYSTTTVYVLKVQPYLTKPTMTLLDTDNVLVSFSYTSQSLE